MNKISNYVIVRNRWTTLTSEYMPGTSVPWDKFPEILQSFVGGTLVFFQEGQSTVTRETVRSIGLEWDKGLVTINRKGSYPGRQVVVGGENYLLNGGNLLVVQDATGGIFMLEKEGYVNSIEEVFKRVFKK